MGVQRGIVVLEDYNPKWKEMFEEEKKNLERVLKDKAVRIEHVGSTAVPGLKSKRIIDICVVVKNLEDARAFEEILKPLDYHFREHQGVDDRYFYAKGPEENRTHYVHCETEDSKSYEHHILFRDYLRTHPEYVEEYTKLKEELEKQYKDIRSEYTKGKADFINHVIELARKEKGAKSDKVKTIKK